MKYFNIYLIVALLYGCSSSSDIPSDFSLVYKSENALMDWRLNITLNSESLILEYKNKQDNISGNNVYNITEREALKIYKYMKSSGFLNMKPPEGEKIVDMPTQNLSGKYGGKSNYIEFGTVKELPESLSTLKQMLFDLASRYNNSWEKDVGLE